MSANRFFQNLPAKSAATPVAALEQVDLGDAVQAGADAQQLDFEIQQLEAMAAGINNLEACVANACADGALDATSFAIVKSQASHIMASTGYEPVNVNTQSFEGGAADRATASTVTMLALGDTAKKIWDAIVKAIKEAMEKVRKWFAAMTNNVPKLIEKFEKLRKQANDKTEGLKDEADIKLSASEVKAIGTGATPKIDRAGILALAGVLNGKKAAVKTVTTAIIEANKGAADAIGSADADDGAKIVATVKNVSAFVKKYLSALGNMGADVDKAEADKLSIGEKSRILDLEVGNKGFVFNIKAGMPDDLTVDSLEGEKNEAVKTHTDALLKVAPAQLSVRTIIEKVEDADEFEFKAFSTSEISSLCDDNIELLTEFKKWKEDQIKIDKERENAIKKTEDFAKKAEKLKGPEGKEAAVRYVTDSAKAATSVVRQTGSLLPGYVDLAVRTSNILLGVGAKSLSAHK